MTLIKVIDMARSLAGEPLSATRTFPDNTSSFWADSRLIDYFNLTQQEVSLEIIEAFEDFFVTATDLAITSGCAAYTLPARFIKTRRVEERRNTTSPTEIFPVNINDFQTIVPSVRNNSAISLYGGFYLRGNEIVFTDTPTYTDASAIRMYYVRALADISAASSISEIPVEHHRVLVWGLLRQMYMEEQSDPSIPTAEFERSLSKLQRYVENRQIQRHRTVLKTRRY